MTIGQRALEVLRAVLFVLLGFALYFLLGIGATQAGLLRQGDGTIDSPGFLISGLIALISMVGATFFMCMIRGEPVGAVGFADPNPRRKLGLGFLWGGAIVTLAVLIPWAARHESLAGPTAGAKAVALAGLRLFGGACSRGEQLLIEIQITPDDNDVWVANPDRNTVTRIEVRRDRNRKRNEIKVGIEPHGIAISPDGARVYVANTQSGTVSVIRTDSDHPRVWRTIRVGTEPYALALTPNGARLYVANARSNDISVIDTDGLRVIRTLGAGDGVGLEPRALAITNDGDGTDTDERLYVTQFLAVDRPGKTIGADDYKEAHVSVFSTRHDRFLHTVVLHPLADVGFNANGNTLAGIAPGANFDQPTGAFPNQLNSIVIKGNHAYLPNPAASPNGPVRFNVNVQSFLSVIDLDTDTEGATINMNRGINLEAASPTRVFLAVPWAAAFEHNANTGYVVASASNLIVKVDLDANGAPTIHALRCYRLAQHGATRRGEICKFSR